MDCLFVTDLHGRKHRYDRLLELLEKAPPDVLFIGGDLLPGGMGMASGPDIVTVELFISRLTELKRRLGERYPRILLILGNDDPRMIEDDVRQAEADSIWEYIHNRSVMLGDHPVYGYACVPPTPFLLKDWERYDVSRYVDPACVSPEEGYRTADLSQGTPRTRTILEDLNLLTSGKDLGRAIFLFHTPPYQTRLDRAALDGRMIDYVPLDVNVGSIAVKRFIEREQPMLTLHGHVHEAVSITGEWQDRLGATRMFGGAHDGPELAVVRFDPDDLDSAVRELL